MESVSTFDAEPRSYRGADWAPKEIASPEGRLGERGTAKESPPARVDGDPGVRGVGCERCMGLNGVPSSSANDILVFDVSNDAHEDMDALGVATGNSEMVLWCSETTVFCEEAVETDDDREGVCEWTVSRPPADPGRP